MRAIFHNGPHDIILYTICISTIICLPLKQRCCSTINRRIISSQPMYLYWFSCLCFSHKIGHKRNGRRPPLPFCTRTLTIVVTRSDPYNGDVRRTGTIARGARPTRRAIRRRSLLSTCRRVKTVEVRKPEQNTERTK